MSTESEMHAVGRFTGNGQVEGCILQAMAAYTESTRIFNEDCSELEKGIVEMSEGEIIEQIRLMLPAGHNLTPPEIQKYHNALTHLTERHVLMHVEMIEANLHGKKIEPDWVGYHIIDHHATPPYPLGKKHHEGIFTI